LIVVDTSALIAVQFDEPEAEAYTQFLLAQTGIAITAPNAFEYMMVAVGRKRQDVLARAERLLAQFGVEVLNFTPELQRIAAQAFLRFGKGRHPAALNFGDCMAYALAKSLDAPLLFKGSDFGQTDVRVALA
jgi:ribonuclease VapC